MNDEHRAAFRMEGNHARTTVVNALRRVILSEVPHIATFRDDTRAAAVAGGFVVAKNTGRLNTDALVDRLALVPIHLTRREVDQFVPGSLTVELRVKNDGKTKVNVTSRDLQARLFGRVHPNARACYPPDPATREWPLITRLYPGEEIEAVATMQKGVARTHAAFAVAFASVAVDLDDGAYQQQRAAIEADADMEEEARARALNLCDHITRKRLVLRREDGEPQGHTLYVESQCGLGPRDILAMAMDVLIKKFTTGSIVFEATPCRTGDTRSATLTVHGQGHTFGSVLQDVCMRDRAALGIRSVGYYETHPLEDRIVVRVDVAHDAAHDAPPHVANASADGVDAADLFARMRAHCARVLEAFRADASI